MIDRRDLLRGVGVVSVGSLSGCMSQISNLANSVTGDSRTTGDSASYNGVEVTPTKYVLADKVTYVFSNNRETRTPDQGATYLLTHLTVSHEGDSAQEFPNSRAQDTIDLFYGGQRVTESMLSDMAQAYIVGEKRLTTYGQARQEADATGEVYPGKTVDGWLIHEIASNFDPSKLELRIVWNQQVIGDEGETTHKWTYATDAEASIEDVEGDGTTITI